MCHLGAVCRSHSSLAGSAGWAAPSLAKYILLHCGCWAGQRRHVEADQTRHRKGVVPPCHHWPALSDGRTGEVVFGRFRMVLVDFGSLWVVSFSYECGCFLVVSARFRPVRRDGRTGERASQFPQSTSQITTTYCSECLSLNPPTLVAAVLDTPPFDS